MKTNADGDFLEVQVTHFSIFGGAGSGVLGGGGSSSGWCALSPNGGGSTPLEFFLPLIVCVLFWLGLRQRSGKSSKEFKV